MEMKRTCPKCGGVHVYRSKRRLWERVLRLRAFRCIICARRFSATDENTGIWRAVKGWTSAR
jgi:ribosomal protein L37AE/L43A